MTSVPGFAPPPALRRRLRGVGWASLAAAGAFATGAALGLLGTRLGPAVVAGLPALAVLAAAGLASPVVAAGLVFAALPVGDRSVPGMPLDVVELAGIAAAGLIVLNRLARGRTPVSWSAPLGWALLLLLAGLVATPRAVDAAAAVKANAQLVAGMLVALALLTAPERMADVRRLAGWLLAVGAGLSLAVLPSLGQLRGSYGGAVVSGRAVGVFAQPNELGSFAGMVAFVGVGLWLGGRTPRGRRWALLGGAAALGSLLASLSRGAWIGAAIAVVGLAALLPEARRRLLAVALPALALSAVLAALYPENPQVQIVRQRLDSITDPAANPYDDRPAIWAEARREIAERPWTGQGPGGFPVASQRSASAAQTVRASHAHNALLTVTAEMGLLGGAALIGLGVAVAGVVARTAGRLRSSSQRRDALLVASLGAALLSVAGHGLVDFPWRNPVLFTVLWALLGLTLAAVRLAGTGGEEQQA